MIIRTSMQSIAAWIFWFGNGTEVIIADSIITGVVSYLFLAFGKTVAYEIIYSLCLFDVYNDLFYLIVTFGNTQMSHLWCSYS